VKDESARLGMPSFKILGASWATFRALAERAGVAPEGVAGLEALRAIVADSPPLLVAATDGNHGRAVARMAALLGLSAHILVPRDMVSARMEALRGEGAEVTVVDGNYDEAVAQSAALAGNGVLVVSDTSWKGYQDVPGWVIDGYATIVDEVLAQLAAARQPSPTVVAAQIGVGAFAASMVRGFVPRGARVIGVEPTEAACVLESARSGRLVLLDGNLDSIMAGLNCGTPSPVAWPTVLAGIDTFIAVTDEDAEEAMRALADAGVVSGESGAAGLAGLLAFAPEIELGPDDHVLVVSTEGDTDPDAYRRIVGDRSATMIRESVV
jgi:diaminopropionate ammonia-lyase